MTNLPVVQLFVGGSTMQISHAILGQASMSKSLTHIFVIIEDRSSIGQLTSSEKDNPIFKRIDLSALPPVVNPITKHGELNKK